MDYKIKIEYMLYTYYDIIFQLNSDVSFEMEAGEGYFQINNHKYEGEVKSGKGYIKRAWEFNRSAMPNPSIWFEIKEDDPRMLIMSIQIGNYHILFLVVIFFFSLFYAIISKNEPFFLLALIGLDLAACWFLDFLFKSDKSSIEDDFIEEYKLKKVSEKGMFKIRID